MVSLHVHSSNVAATLDRPLEMFMNILEEDSVPRESKRVNLVLIFKAVGKIR